MVYRFSPSSLSLLKECERCFWLAFNKGIKRPEGIFSSLPMGVDMALKKHFDAYRGKGSVPPVLRGLSVRLFDNMEVLSVWRNNFKGVSWKDAEGNVLRGAVDDLLEKNGKLIILDYKTRGFPLKEDASSYYQDQLDIYSFLLVKNGYAVEDYAYLLYYYPSKAHENGDLDFTKELVKMNVDAGNAEKILSKALRVLKGEMPASSETCGWCAWLKVCTKNAAQLK